MNAIASMPITGTVASAKAIISPRKSQTFPRLL